MRFSASGGWNQRLSRSRFCPLSIHLTLYPSNATASGSSSATASASHPTVALIPALVNAIADSAITVTHPVITLYPPSANAAGVGGSVATAANPLATLNTANASASTNSTAATLFQTIALTPANSTASGVGVTSLSSADLLAIANAVWSHSSAVQCETMLLEVWGRLGLDPSSPLITGTTQITFGSIVMAMAEVSNQVTVTRQ